MKLESLLNQHNFSPALINLLSQTGITQLYPAQAEAVRKGVLEGKHFLLSCPTASGKTFIAEMCMLKTIVEESGRCLYVVPLKALAHEKYLDFQKKYAPHGIAIGLSTGDLEAPSLRLNKFQILIATAEKVDSLLRFRGQGLIHQLSLVILDEIHFINDPARGPTLEILTARIKHLNPQMQILALSATISNAKELAQWLKAEYIISNWRPVPLKEGVYYNHEIQFANEGTRQIHEDHPDDLCQLTLDTLRQKGQVLIFVNSRRSAQAASRLVSEASGLVLTEEEKQQLHQMAQRITGPGTDATKICRSLADVIRKGAAFHHAGLKPKQREMIEEGFRKNLLKVICSTPTLASGVNLPARRAIIRDVKRFESGLGSTFISIAEYKQCAGRAGRPQYDPYGEAILIAKSPSDREDLLERFIHATPEPITSKLNNPAALRIHILASIVGGHVHDVKEMLDFLTHTFLYFQKQAPALLEIIADIFEFLHQEGFIEKKGFRFSATPFGLATSRLYLDPLTSLMFRKGFHKVQKYQTFSHVTLLHILSSTPDCPRLNVRKKDGDALDAFTAHFQEEIILLPEDLPGKEGVLAYAATLQTTWMLFEWIEEEKEEMICDQFGIGPGDIYRIVEVAEWLAYAAVEFSDLWGLKRLSFALEKLKKQLHYGIKEELLDLVLLKGVGRVRARILYNRNFKTRSDLKYASEETLAGLKTIDKTLAKDILNQVWGKTKSLTPT